MFLHQNGTPVLEVFRIHTQKNFNNLIHMKIIKTGIKDCYIIEPKLFADKRGYFFESFNKKKFESLTAMKVEFVQDNESFSKFGTIRGLHIQKGKMMQAKLVRVIHGKVKDVVIDVRPDSPTFNKKFEIEISAINKKQLFVPKGFLHGFSVLSETAIFSYKCDNYYDRASESGVNPLDQTLNINWDLKDKEYLISQKDLSLNNFNNFSFLD